MAAGKLWHVRFRQWDGAVGAERGDGPVVRRGAMFSKDRRTVGGQLAFDIVVVLDGDRQAGEPARMVGALVPESLRLRAGLVQKADGQGIDGGLNGGGDDG